MLEKKTILVGSIVLALLLGIALLAGCGSSGGTGGDGEGSGKPTLISFTRGTNPSIESMKPIIEKLKTDLAGKVVFIDVDLDNPADLAKIEKLEIDPANISMVPTYMILNKEGQIKETYMGAATEDMLANAIRSFIPGEQTAPTTTPQETPSQFPPGSETQTIPATPEPGSSQ